MTTIVRGHEIDLDKACGEPVLKDDSTTLPCLMFKQHSGGHTDRINCMSEFYTPAGTYGGARNYGSMAMCALPLCHKGKHEDRHGNVEEVDPRDHTPQPVLWP